MNGPTGREGVREMKKLIAVGILSGAMAVAGVAMTQRAASAFSTTNCYRDYFGNVHCTTIDTPTYQPPMYQPTFHSTNCYRDYFGGVHCTTY
jgi:hypothetical protein